MQEQIINILADATGRDAADFSDASQDLFTSGLLDSMATVSVLLGLQDEFGFRFPFLNSTGANGTRSKRLNNG